MMQLVNNYIEIINELIKTVKYFLIAESAYIYVCISRTQRD